ncbi:DUF4166 domain-containing protein [Caulobacter sp. UNC279MFTsu5.1]|uniref:DUF4166 domain-containing protein n=1 Tax=Caulobacter sp. UNC279MFTsu5.1 TaxID=1502775 RepID=UPI0008E74460|nr:DUF4166 domain-containing protein [Caulobacter sp. UNC279MFTsu5.1]SFJ02056.1 protein of unknown function [Caulobacter sp. UNC279MFTsu5.1]
MLEIAGTLPAAVRDLPETAPAELHDLRFRTLLGEAGWSRLPQAVRDRFSKRLRPGMAVTYVGEITESRRNRAGWALAQLCRLIGAPLPLYDDLGVAAVVTVTEDGRAGGQFWTRMYNQAHGFPQVIHSSKRFAGPTGLEEYLGCGFGITLAVSADETALHFHSRGYFLALGPARLGLRLRLPAWLAPGALTISHIDQGDGGFAFVLDLRHPLLGRMLRQVGMFRERPASEEQGR